MSAGATHATKKQPNVFLPSRETLMASQAGHSTDFVTCSFCIGKLCTETHRDIICVFFWLFLAEPFPVPIHAARLGWWQHHGYSLLERPKFKTRNEKKAPCGSPKLQSRHSASPTLQRSALVRSHTRRRPYVEASTATCKHQVNFKDRPLKSQCTGI